MTLLARTDPGVVRDTNQDAALARLEGTRARLDDPHAGPSAETRALLAELIAAEHSDE